MLVAGIIAEYNPFHNGHDYHIKCTKKYGATHIVAVMSGNYVQRGDTAILDKLTRAKMAIDGGVDLVIELPTVFSLAVAQRFATGAVALMQSLNCIDILSFGSECGEIDTLNKAKNALESINGSDALQYHLTLGLPYPTARSRAVQEMFGTEISDILTTPNNLLGIEYLSALSTCNSTIKPYTIPRFGVDHDGTNPSKSIASASYIRQLIYENKLSEIQNFIPPQTYELIYNQITAGFAPARLQNAYIAVLAKLRALSPEQLAKTLDVSEGLDYRIYNAIQSATNLDDLYAKIKSKRYTLSRIKRIILYAFLGIYNTASPMPQYIKVLAFNDKGRELLKVIKTTSTLPIIQQFSDTKQLNQQALLFYNNEALYTDLYGLCCPTILPCGIYQRENSIFIKE